jgi:hypothetical protein
MGTNVRVMLKLGDLKNYQVKFGYSLDLFKFSALSHP